MSLNSSTCRASIPGLGAKHHEPAPLSSESAPDPEQLRRLALAYALRGHEILACKDWPKKDPHYIRGLLEHGHLDATSDPRRVRAMWTHKPAASIGLKLGHYVLIDTDVREGVDGYASRAELERQHGNLPETLTISTPSSGEHGYYLVPEGMSLKNRTGAGALAPGLEFKCEGYALAPPSPGYTVKARRKVAELPTEWVKLLAEPWSGTPALREAASPPAPMSIEGPPIRYGSRWATLHSIAGSLHDGTRDLGQLTADLEAINAARCLPRLGDHHTDRPDEVERLARLVYRMQPCRPKGAPDPEFEALLDEANRGWYECFLLSGDNKSTVRDTMRACLGSIAKRREVRTVVLASGEKARVLVFAESTRELEMLTRSSDRAVSDHLRQLQAAGLFVVLHSPPAGRTTYGLLPRAHWCISPHQRLYIEGQEAPLLGTDTVLRSYELSTPPFGWFAHVTSAMRRILCLIEAFGPQSANALNVVLRTARLSDLERRQLRPLQEMGLLERCGEEWRLPEDYVQRIEALEDAEYSTTFRRRRRSRDGDRVVTDVVEVVVTASENERDALRAARQAIERAAYAVRLEEQQAEEERCRDLLCEMDAKRGADGFTSELEKVEEEGADSRDGRFAASRRRRTEERHERVARLTREGMAPDLARAAVYGGDALEV